MISLTPMQILPLNPCAMAWLILLPSFLAARVVPPCSLFPYTTLFRSPAGADPAAPLRAVVADDHPVVRDGLVAMLGSDPEIEVVGVAADGRQALAVIADTDPDVVLMDLRMPGGGGAERSEERRVGAEW